MLPVQDLAALIAVADAGSIHGAAEVLGRTQPAVTQAIQRLEEAVGFPLLDRSGYRVSLTERGAIFAKRARATVKQARDLRVFAAVLERGVEAKLRISVHGAIPPQAWMHIIREIPERFPDTVLELHVGEGDAPIRRLQNDECDFALVLALAADHHNTNLERIALGAMEFVTVVQAARIHAGEEAMLAALPQILVADFDDPATSYGVVEGHRYWRMSDHRAKAATIVGGAGWGSVPAHLIEKEIREGVLRLVSYGGLGQKSAHTFYLYRKREKPQGPVATFIWEAGARAAENDKPTQSS